MTMKLVFARPLDDNRSAVVIDMGNGKVVGGVVIISEMNNNYGNTTTNFADLADTIKKAGRYENIRTSQLTLQWQWSKSVNASDLMSGKVSLFDSDPEPEMKVVESKPKTKSSKGKKK